MVSEKKYRMFCGDFETSVYEGQETTEVWAAAYVEIGHEEVTVHNNLLSYFTDILNFLKAGNVKLYFHNLKFDGHFILDFFIRKLKFKQAGYYYKPGDPFAWQWKKDDQMLDREIKYMIAGLGQWYKILIRFNGHFLEIRDSLKLLPFSLAKIGKDFKTKHQKTSIEYVGERHENGYITPEEREYISNDVLVMKEALEIMFDMGNKKLTIGSCCLSEYREMTGKEHYKRYFPDLTKHLLPKAIFGSENADAYIRKAYRGGWCYLVKGKEETVFHNGITLDVNSLYPSVMSGESNNAYPWGEPHFWTGDYIPDEALIPGRYYFIRVRTGFEIKDGFLPTIQIKNNLMYRQNEYLTTSKIEIGGRPVDRVQIGEYEYDDHVTLTLTMTDWQLVQDHYNLYDTEILDGAWFYALRGMFEDYIEKYKQIKMREKGAKRTWAKLMLNNLYGKLASNPHSDFKYCYFDDDDVISFRSCDDANRPVVYIPAGAAVTAYARDFTIRAAQANYYGADKPGIIYSDTDSLHLDIPLEDVRGVELSDTEFLKWKHESSWSEGFFSRQKTYIEKTERGYNVTACGMGKRCKELVSQALDPQPDFEIRNEEEAYFLSRKMELTDFVAGFRVPGNLKQRRIKGGVILFEDWFELH